MTTNANPLENLEFFEMFSNDDPLETPSYDPNKNIAADILGNPDAIQDPILDPADDNPEPPAPNLSPAQDPIQDPLEDDANEDDSDLEPQPPSTGLEDDDDDEVNYFEVFGAGLAKAGVLELEEGEEIEWSEETFLAKMSETVEKRAWDTLESLAAETYGEAGIKLVEDLFINKAPIQQYLQMFNNEQIVENVNLESPVNQERIVRLYLAKTGLDEDAIEDQISYMNSNEKLEAYSKKYHGKLLEKMEDERMSLAEQSRLETERRAEFEEQRNQQYASVLQESLRTGDIKGYPINEQAANELFSFVLDKPHQLPNGQRITDFEYKLAKMRQEEPEKFLAVARIVQSDLDLTPVKRRGVSEETNSIFNDLKTKTKKTTKGSKSDGDLFQKYFK
jgi:hypothetical protein